MYLTFPSTEILESVVTARLSRSIYVLPTDVHCPTVHVPVDSTCLGDVCWYSITTLGKVTFHDIETREQEPKKIIQYRPRLLFSSQRSDPWIIQRSSFSRAISVPCLNVACHAGDEPQTLEPLYSPFPHALIEMIQTGSSSRGGTSDASSGIIHLCCL